MDGEFDCRAIMKEFFFCPVVPHFFCTMIERTSKVRGKEDQRLKGQVIDKFESYIRISTDISNS